MNIYIKALLQTFGFIGGTIGFTLGVHYLFPEYASKILFAVFLVAITFTLYMLRLADLYTGEENSK